MIYSVNFFDMAEKLNPLAVCQYMEQTEWKKYPFKRRDIRVYQKETKTGLLQATVPLDRSLTDYKVTMYDTVVSIAEAEKRSVERVMLHLLNPNTDIIKIRLQKQEVEAGNILFDDAIELYDNAKKLIAATAMDIINPRRNHYGRVSEPVEAFLSQCRFGQTEVGSYIVSVVCPFAELSEDEEYRQLSIFSDEDRCASSLTRKVTNKLMDNIAFIKEKIDEGNIEAISSDESGISSNFLEAVNGIGLQSENALVDFTPEWSPVVKKNRSNHTNIRITNDYYQPIAAAVDRIKAVSNKRTEIIGRIKQLAAAPSVDKREDGTAVVVFLDGANKAKSVKIKLSKEDYEAAVEAYKSGKAVKAVGDLAGGSRLVMDNVAFSVID